MVWWILAIASGIQCNQYDCSDSYKFHQGQCIASNYTSSIMHLKKCPSGQFCPPVNTPGLNSTCQYTSDTYSSQKYPGQYCSISSDCLSGECVNNQCKSGQIGDQCYSHIDCDAQLYCSKQLTCQKQIEQGKPGCRNQYDCVNSSGCLNMLYANNGVCIPYQSVPYQQKVDTCQGGLNLLCSEQACLTYNNTDHRCVKPPSSGYLPRKCNNDEDCISSDGYSVSNCVCSYSNDNSAGYCQLFPGDQIYQDLLKIYQKIYQDKDFNEKCHTLTRFSDECVKMVTDNDLYNEYIYKKQLALSYANQIEAQDCALEIYMPTYYSAKGYYESDSGMFYTISGIVLAYFI